MIEKGWPRIRAVFAEAPSTLDVTRSDGRSDCVELADSITIGAGLLSALQQPEIFASVRIGEYVRRLHGAQTETP